MWKIGPECAAQQAKKVSASTRNCGDRRACAADMPLSAVTPDLTPGLAIVAVEGARRTNSAAGSNNDQARMPMRSMAVRQSWVQINSRANGEMVMGATPMPAETSETARLRFSANHAVAAAITGAKKALAARPTRMP